MSRNLMFGAVLLLVVPAVVLAMLLWSQFSTQIEEGYEKLLVSGLNVLEMSLRNHMTDSREALVRLAADNTLKVTLELDIRPQLRRYLKQHWELSHFYQLVVLDLAGESIAKAGHEQVRLRGCDAQGLLASAGRETEWLGNRLLVVHRVPVLDDMRPLGYLCGAFALDGVRQSGELDSRVEGITFLAWRDHVVALSKDAGDLGRVPLVEGRFDWNDGQRHYLGMSRLLGDTDIRIGLLLDRRPYDLLLARSLGVTALVVLLVLVATVSALRLFRQRLLAEHSLQEERKNALATLSSIMGGVITTDALGAIRYANPAAEKLLDTSAHLLEGVHWRRCFSLWDEASGMELTDLREICEADHREGFSNITLVTASQHRIPVHMSIAPRFLEGEPAGYAITLHDIRHERALRDQLAWKASHDDLTGLFNRAEFRLFIARLLKSLDNGHSHHCLLYIDLDDFKVVNDSCGHRAGDDLLRRIAALLSSHLRQSDKVARLGGDEFGILLHDCPLERGRQLAHALVEAISDMRFGYGGQVFHIGASIGLVGIDKPGIDLDDLLAAVDMACYTAKERGRNRVVIGAIGDDQMAQRAEELRQASGIRKALKEGRLRLFRQPIVSVSDDNGVTHYEILVRLLDEDGELVAPDRFIPVAERHGLMEEIDRWVVSHLLETRSAELRSSAAGRGAGGGFLYSINLSGASLNDPEFLDFVKEQLNRHQVPPTAIAFEITETLVISRLDKAAHLIQALRGMGCRFLLDDFGSGMSSFGYLKRLPVDYLKIDGQFVRDILDDPVDRAMVRAINDIGHVMKLTTIAEYVENDQILAVLKDFGVDMAQGYGIGRPQPLAEHVEPPQLQLVRH